MTALKDLPPWLQNRVSAHRGYRYAHNTLAAIESAVDHGFIMVEFDVQLYDGRLVLGHYRHEAGAHNVTLIEALHLFKGASSMPKIDIKLPEERITEQNINHIVREIMRAYADMKLINISRLGTRAELHTHFKLEHAAKAEKLFYKACKKYGAANLVLNLDVQRYMDGNKLPNQDVEKHIRSINDLVYSFSPDLSQPDIIEKTYKIAENTGIRNINFWMMEDAEPRSIRQLKKIYDDAVARGFYPMFDIDLRHHLVESLSHHAAAKS